jgi:hypothetical protein
LLDNDVAWPEYPMERDTVDIDVIHPDTEVDICTYPCLSPAIVYNGKEFSLRVDEMNTGDVPLTDVSVTVSADPAVDGFPVTLDLDSEYSNSGDTNDNGILDPGEVWTWIIDDVVITEVTTFVAIGDAMDPMENRVTWDQYEDERDEIEITPIDPDTLVDVNVLEDEDVSVIDDEVIAYAGGTVDLEITEENTGDDALLLPYVWLALQDTDGVNITTWSLGKDSDYYVEGDTNGDGVLDADDPDTVEDEAETWVWEITGVVVNQDSMIIAKGHGMDSLHNDVSYDNGYLDERDIVEIDTIDPDTKVVVTSSEDMIYEGETVDLTVTETNTGDDPLDNPHVWVGGLNSSGHVIDLNADDPDLMDGWVLDKDSAEFVSGDTTPDWDPLDGDDPGNGILEVGETWTWTITGVELNQDVVIIAKGHGLDSLENDVTHPEYPRERSRIVVETIDPDTETCISTTEDEPAITIRKGDTVDLLVTESNTGDDPITSPSVTVYDADDLVTPLYVLDKASTYYVEGDINDNGILDPDDPMTAGNEGEDWIWIIIDVPIDGNTTFVAFGDGLDSLGNNVNYENGYEDERDQIGIDVVDPDTQVCLTVCPCPLAEHTIYEGDELFLTISETNTGDEALNNPYIWVAGLNSEGLVIDLNTDDAEMDGWLLDKADLASGDTNDNDILDIGETWIWTIDEVVVQEDVTLVVKGHGTSPGLEEDITYPEYPHERDAAYVTVVEVED